MKPLLRTTGSPPRPPRARGRNAGFSLVEVAVAVAILTVAFVGLFGTIRQANKLASGAEDDALAECALEQRVDQLRCLEWPDLTTESGLKTKIFNARPKAVSGMRIIQETVSLSPVDLPAAQTISATWTANGAPTSSATPGTALISAKAVKAVATLTWMEKRMGKAQTRSLVTVISRGGISKSDRP